MAHRDRLRNPQPRWSKCGLFFKALVLTPHMEFEHLVPAFPFSLPVGFPADVLFDLWLPVCFPSASLLAVLPDSLLASSVAPFVAPFAARPLACL